MWILRKKQDKNLLYNWQHSFTKFKDIDEFKELSLDSMDKKLTDLKKNDNKLKAVSPQTDEHKVLKPKVLDNVGDLFNDLCYIGKDKYNEEKDVLNTKNKKHFYYKKLRLLIINTSLKNKKKKKKNKRLVKSLIKRNHFKNQQKMIGLN